MTATTSPRKTPKMGTKAVAERLSVPIKAATKLLAGTIGVSNAGYAQGGATATGLKALGLIIGPSSGSADIDNTSGSNGDKRVEIERGTFKFANLGADPVVQADLFATCYIADNQTVAHSDGTGTRSACGKVMQVDSDGVWVEIL